MALLEASVRSVEQPGLLWGLAKLVPIGYGIKKLQITVVIEDELVSLDELQEKLAEFEEYIQSSGSSSSDLIFFGADHCSSLPFIKTLLPCKSCRGRCPCCYDPFWLILQDRMSNIQFPVTFLS